MKEGPRQLVRSGCFTVCATLAVSALFGGISNSTAGQYRNGPGGHIPLATGSHVQGTPAAKGPFFNITKFGAMSNGPALANQAAINKAIVTAARVGGTVVIPAGVFKTYTIHLASNVALHFESTHSVLRAAIPGTGAGEDGGFYDAPEPNPYVGLQDEGHSHWANSLIVGDSVKHIMISGPGLINGSYLGPDGKTVKVLTSSDVAEVTARTAAGKPGGANKAIALKNAADVVFRDFRIKYGGHFAILGTGVRNWTVDGILVDSNRDGIDIDASQDVTIRNSTFNTLNDDAVVLKGTFALGRYAPTRNVLIENCTVSGYDTGSVLDRTYSVQQSGPPDGPTGRIKLGTESTTGFDTVTVRHIRFDRSRGFALESVDGAALKNVIFTDVTMTHVTSAPIFIILGDRGRSPVTGNSADESLAPVDTVRLDDREWVLPNRPAYGTHPAVRYIPSYNRNQIVSGEGGSHFAVVNQAAPTQLNAASVRPRDPLYANAVGAPFATLENVAISNVKITDSDPRFPIIITGLVDHPVRNVSIQNVSVGFRGGLKMRDAVEQSADHNEALLPRIGWDPEARDGKGGWTDDPYNIPEAPREYPEPSMYGVLPAYGLYARHVQGLKMRNVRLSYGAEDERPPVVLDDVRDSSFIGFAAMAKSGTPDFVMVTNARKREAENEFVPDFPYRMTTVSNVFTPPDATKRAVTILRPAPGTPPDRLYGYPTVPSAVHPYAYATPDTSYRPR
ncbi:glycoside hydrolase family 28 protein [Paraburkholderia diazotrophica]|uniref:Polygalacturonase n=1 Tax=Paraburkholderia diazotrophica TaxID=667676 RepID=A0A1H6YR40_9BURK|nr:right-handed parallel beta-helix repeat-containing protein [Paraburkholderia diazotrophica]SEJ39790.1 Polygalacturonase [Paraburkholderia diazotrophica]